MEREKKLKKDPLLIPGREDASMYPAIGKLDLKSIIRLDEKTIDERLALHLQGESPFAKTSEFTDPARRLAIKIVFLAVLEGVPSHSKSLEDWYERVRGAGELVDTRHAIEELIYRMGSVAYKERRTEVRKFLPEINARIPNNEDIAILDEINTILAAHQIGPLTIHQILQVDTIRKTAAKQPQSETKNKVWDQKALLQLFLAFLQNVDNDKDTASKNITNRFNVKDTDIRVIKFSRFTQTAKDILSNLRRVRKNFRK